MNKLILIIPVLLITLGMAATGQSARQFTNEDLKQYKTAPDAETSAETSTEPVKSSPINEINEPEAPITTTEATEKTYIKYIIPYTGSARRIIIPVTFDRRITVPMLLDTGATGMHISTRLARKIGLLDDDEKNLWTRVAGIGGSTPAILTILDSVQVGEAEDNFIPTTISPASFRGFEGLVGMDFIGKYHMQINTRKREVILEELPESPLRPAGHDELWWRTTFRHFKSRRSDWAKYRNEFRKTGDYTSTLKEVKIYVEKQYDRADYLYNRLKVYASEHSVPLEWR